MNENSLYDWNIKDAFSHASVLGNKFIFEKEDGAYVIELNTGRIIDKFSKKYNDNYYIERYKELRENLSFNCSLIDLFRECWFDRNRNIVNKKIVDERWEAMGNFIYNMAIIYKDGKYGVVDEEGNILIEFSNKYKKIKLLPYYNVLLKDKNNNLSLYKKCEGVLFDFDENIRYDDLEIIKSKLNYYYVRKNDKYGIIDKKGNIVLNCIYDELLGSEKEFIIFARRGNITEVYNENFEKILTIDGRYFILWLNRNSIDIRNRDIMYQKTGNVYLFNINTRIERCLNKFIEIEELGKKLVKTY